MPLTKKSPAKKSPARSTEIERPYHHGNLREALLSAARQIVLRDGTSALTVRELARRAGVSHSAPAHHFGDRTGILVALATQGFDGLSRAMEDEAKGAPDPEARLLSLGLGYVRFAAAEPALMEVMFHPEVARPATITEERGASLRDASGRAFELLSDAVRAVVPDATAEAQADIALASWSLVHGFAALERAGATARRGAKTHAERARRATAERLVALLMEAVTRRRTPLPPRARSGSRRG